MNIPRGWIKLTVGTVVHYVRASTVRAVYEDNSKRTNVVFCGIHEYSESTATSESWVVNESVPEVLAMISEADRDVKL